MNRYFEFCWAASYICVFVSLLKYAWAWADKVDTLDALLFWMVLVSVFGIIGVWLVRSIRENGGN